MRERSERVEHRDLDDVPLEIHRVADCVSVDAHRGDRAVDQLDVHLLDAEVVRHLTNCLAERSPLYRLKRRGEIRLGDACLGLRPRHGHGRAEAANLLAGDPDDRLARDRLAHVLGLGQRAVAVVDDRLEVGDGACLHVGLRLTDLTDPEHDALVVLAFHDQGLDELGADVEHRVVGLELLTPLEQGELSLSHQAACPMDSVMVSRSSDTAASRLDGSPTLPRPRSGRPPPLPPVICAALVTRVPAWMPASSARPPTLTTSVAGPSTAATPSPCRRSASRRSPAWETPSASTSPSRTRCAKGTPPASSTIAASVATDGPAWRAWVTSRLSFLNCSWRAATRSGTSSGRVLSARAVVCKAPPVRRHRSSALSPDTLSIPP